MDTCRLEKRTQARELAADAQELAAATDGKLLSFKHLKHQTRSNQIKPNRTKKFETALPTAHRSRSRTRFSTRLTSALFRQTGYFVGICMLTAIHAGGRPAHALVVDEGFVNPLGFYDENPLFSWQLTEGVKKQTAYRLQTTSNGKRWDSGWVQSDQSVLVPC